jgi:hypothetical protein
MPAPFEVRSATNPGVVLFTVDASGNVTFLGGLPVTKDQTILVTRDVIAATGANMLEYRAGGNRGFYINEAGEGRAQAQKNDVSFRVKSNVADDGTAQSTFEVTKSDNTVLFAVDASGNLNITGTVGGAAGYGAFADVTPAANVLQGTPHLQSRTEPGSVTRLLGQLTIDVAGVVSGVALNVAIPAAQRPAAAAIFTIRFSGGGAAAALFTMSAAGVLSCSTNLVSGDVMNFDGVTFVHA